MYCLVPEKPLRLFIPLIFSGGIWSACGGLLSTQGHFLRAPSVILFTKALTVGLAQVRGDSENKLAFQASLIIIWGDHRKVSP
ncbi:MAG: hypothetical protein JRE29_07285 [Deltaproteobacteria bacterium]|nr:hypothetical protein [Deltaproteobacteria bacterium]